LPCKELQAEPTIYPSPRRPKGQESLAQGLPWVSQNKRYALTRHMNVRSMNNTRSSGLEMLKGLEHFVQREEIESTISLVGTMALA
jgi:hypothetical protein